MVVLRDDEASRGCFPHDLPLWGLPACLWICGRRTWIDQRPKKGIREELDEETICEGRKAEVSLVHARHPFWTQSLQSQILGFTFFLILHSLAHDLCGSIWVRGTRAYGRGVGRGGVEGPGIFKSRCLA